nr:endonuclease/exonuclease/phosphatase family protein [Lentilactobacillus otakiensis]
MSGLVLIVGVYVAYVYLTYHRVPDNVKLKPHNRNSQVLQTNHQYKAMTFNIGYAAYPKNYSFFMDGGKYSRAFSKQSVLNDLNGIHKAVQQVDPTLMFFQEVDTNGDRSFHVNEVQWLRDRMSNYSSVYAQNYDSAYLFYPLTRPIGRAKSGLVTLAKAKISDSTRYQLPIDTDFNKFMDLDRAISVTHIPVNNGKQLAVINLHMSAFTKNAKVRKAQIEKLFAKMKIEQAAGNYVMVAGDYNHDMLGNSPEVFGTTGKRMNWTHPFPADQLPKGFRIAKQGLADAKVPSVRANGTPYHPGKTYTSLIDGFLLSDNIQVNRVHVKSLGFKNSDHNPEVLEFELK